MRRRQPSPSPLPHAQESSLRERMRLGWERERVALALDRAACEQAEAVEALAESQAEARSVAQEFVRELASARERIAERERLAILADKARIRAELESRKPSKRSRMLARIEREREIEKKNFPIR